MLRYPLSELSSFLDIKSYSFVKEINLNSTVHELETLIVIFWWLDLAN